MADQFAVLRSLLDRVVPVDEAISPYLGLSAHEADKDADADETSEGLRRDRLRGLVTIIALNEAPPALAMLAAALVWRSAPVAARADEIRTAIGRIADWRAGLGAADVARIAAAHRRYELRFAEILKRTGRAEGPEIDELAYELSDDSPDDHVVAQLGDHLLIVEMTADDFFVGLQSQDGDIIVIDRVPHGGGGWGRDGEDEPTDPGPRILQDA